MFNRKKKRDKERAEFVYKSALRPDDDKADLPDWESLMSAALVVPKDETVVQLLAGIHDQLAIANWQRAGGKPWDYPKPILRNDEDDAA